MIINEKTFFGKVELNYIFQREITSDYLLIFFSSFPKADESPSYSYLKSFDNLKCNKMFILDNFGEGGFKVPYFIGSHRGHEIENSVVELIDYICLKYNFNKDNIIAAGSSEGGSAALYFGIKYNYGHILAGAPQYYIGNFLIDNNSADHNKMAEYIAGSKDNSAREYLNSIIKDAICNAKEFNDIRIFCSAKDAHLNGHVEPLIKDLEQVGGKVLLSSGNYGSHNELGKYYIEYVNENIPMIIKNEDKKRDKKNYAAYVLGDDNICLGALATLTSFNKYNPDIDLYLYIEKGVNFNKYCQYFNELEIKVIDITPYKKYASIFEQYQDSGVGMAWPTIVFLNYLVPYLLNKDYKYSIKLDYDLLTLKTIDLEEIKPVNHQVLSSIYNPFNLFKMVKIHAEYYKNKYTMKYADMGKIGINTGFLVINNETFCDYYDVFQKMQQMYCEIKKDDYLISKDIYADQGLLTMCVGFNCIPTKEIDNKYNTTTHLLNNLNTIDEVVNIHYTGSVKPWKKAVLDETYLDVFGGVGYLSSLLWLRFMMEQYPAIYQELNIDNTEVMINAFLTINQQRIHERKGKNEALKAVQRLQIANKDIGKYKRTYDKVRNFLPYKVLRKVRGK